MAAKRVLGRVERWDTELDLISQVCRQTFGGADGLVIHPSEHLPGQALAEALETPAVLWLQGDGPLHLEAWAQVGVSQVVFPGTRLEELRPVVQQLGPLRVALSLDGLSLLQAGEAAEHAAELGLCELYVPEKMCRDEALIPQLRAGAWVLVGVADEDTPMAEAIEWLLSGGDGWLTSAGTTASPLKGRMAEAGLRVRP